MTNSINLKLPPLIPLHLVPLPGGAGALLQNTNDSSGEKAELDVNRVALLIIECIGNNKWIRRAILEYLTDEKFYLDDFNARILKASPRDLSCVEFVPVPEKYKSLEKTLAKVDFPLEIGSTKVDCEVSDAECEDSGKIIGRRADVKSPPFFMHPRYTFGMIFSNEGNLEIEISFIHTLQKWCRVGDKSGWFCDRRGLPTAKVIMTLMMRKLGVTRDNLKSITIESQNALTHFHFLFEFFEKERSVAASYALSHSSQLNAELAHTLGGKLYLEGIRCAAENKKDVDMSIYRNLFWESVHEREINSPLDRPLVEYLSLENFEKFKALRCSTGVDLFEDIVWTPNIVSLRYRFEKC